MNSPSGWGPRSRQERAPAVRNASTLSYSLRAGAMKDWWRFIHREVAIVQETGFCTLLYRYFFFGWLFKDVGQGSDLFERAAAMRHNREQARWLPTYMLRWLWWGLLFYALGRVCELMLDAAPLAVVFYAAGAVSVPVDVAIAAAWIGLKGLQGPA